MNSVPEKSNRMEIGAQILKAFNNRGRIEGQTVFLSNGKLLIKGFDEVKDCQNMTGSAMNNAAEFRTLNYDSKRKSFRTGE